jgi:hypothetical protein
VVWEGAGAQSPAPDPIDNVSCAHARIRGKIVLVLFRLLVKVRFTMKRIYTLIVLLGIVMGAVLTGCNQASDTSKPADTNAPPAASTNK